MSFMYVWCGKVNISTDDYAIEDICNIDNSDAQNYIIGTIVHRNVHFFTPNHNPLSETIYTEMWLVSGAAGVKVVGCGMGTIVYLIRRGTCPGLPELSPQVCESPRAQEERYAKHDLDRGRYDPLHTHGTDVQEGHSE